MLSTFSNTLKWSFTKSAAMPSISVRVVYRLWEKLIDLRILTKTPFVHMWNRTSMPVTIKHCISDFKR